MLGIQLGSTLLSTSISFEWKSPVCAAVLSTSCRNSGTATVGTLYATPASRKPLKLTATRWTSAAGMQCVC